MLGALGSIVGPAEAQVSERWSRPATVAGAPDAFPRIDFSRAGTGLLSWSVHSVAGDGRVAGDISGAVIRPDGSVGPAERISSRQPGEVRLYGRDRTMVVGLQPRAGISAPLRVGFGRVGDRVGGLRSVLPAARAFSVDANQTGDAAITAAACITQRCARTRPVLLIKRRGGDFGRPVALDRGGRTHRTATSVNARGDVLAVWVRNDVAYARIRTAGGRLQRLQTLGSVRSLPALSADLGDARRAVVAFGGQHVSEGDPTGPFVGWVAYASPRRGFDPRQRLETIPSSGTGTYVAGALVAAAVLNTGRVVAAWTGLDDGRYVVRVGNARGRIRDVETLSNPEHDAQLAALAAGPRGEVAVTWTSGAHGAQSGAGPKQLFASVRGGTAERFDEPEPVSEAATQFITGEALAFNPANGRLTAAWSQDSEPIRYASRVPVG